MKVRNLAALFLISTLLFACGGGDSSSTAGDAVIVKFTVANLPATIPINQTNTIDNYLEHHWVVEFDINKNGIMDAGDVAIQIENYKRPGSSPLNKSVTELDTFLTEYESDVVSTLTQLTGAVSVSGSTIIVTVPKYESRRLENLTNDVHVHFGTFGTLPTGGNDYVADYYPTNFDSFAPMTSDGKFTDGDDVFPQDVKFADLLAMEITF